MTTDLGPCEEYFLHVLPDGTEVAAEIPRKSLRVLIKKVGEDFVDESTKVFTVAHAEGGRLIFDVVKPRGEGWERDAEAETDPWWTLWRRRRTWKVEN